jgi:hypothetical protein
MSGAAIFAPIRPRGEVLVGIVVSHNASEGEGALGVEPIGELDPDEWVRLGIAVAVHELKAPPKRRQPKRRPKVILVVGAANEECVLKIFPWEAGGKFSATGESLLGGSGLNYARRLVKYDNCPAVPIVPIGRDSVGEKILA